jgi:hypothetical protein
LFQIQPIVAKMILPWFGGSSSVWSTCLVFFQAELLLGYLYVHLLHEWLSPRRQNLVHGVLLLLSLATLPVIADPAWKDAAQEQPDLERARRAGRGGRHALPAAVDHRAADAGLVCALVRQHDALPLYALSNLASMLALLSYPVLVEPYFPVLEQAWAWSAAYVCSCSPVFAAPGNRGKGYRANARRRTTSTAADAAPPGASACCGSAWR